MQDRYPSPKDKIETLLKLADTHWRDSDARRAFEWKSNFALWAPLAAAGAYVAIGDKRPSLSMSILAAMAILAVFLFYWRWWQVGMWRHNHKDTERAKHAWMRVRDLIGEPMPQCLEYPIPETHPNYRWTDYFRIWNTWSRGAQLWTTAVLAVATIVAILYPHFPAITIEFDAWSCFSDWI